MKGEQCLTVEADGATTSPCMCEARIDRGVEFGSASGRVGSLIKLGTLFSNSQEGDGDQVVQESVANFSRGRRAE